MGFTEIEQAGKKLFEQFPFIKRSAKRIYQLASVAISGEKIKYEGNISKVSPGDGYEYFYGYYDKSPWDSSDHYMICIRVSCAYKSVAPKEAGEVGVIDRYDNNRFIKIGTTHSWNVQQGCMAQWLGPDFKSRILYNDFRDGHYCAVIYDFVKKKEEKVLPMAAYDVACDGSFFLSLDFSRLHRMRPGYGYSNLKESTRKELCPDKCCIWKVNIDNGKVTELFKYTDFMSFEPDSSMVGAAHKVNHIMISPNCKRFMVLHRWFYKGRKHTRLVTVNVDGTEMYNLSDDVFVSHCYWKNNHEILSFLRKKESGDHYYLMKDKTHEYKMLWPELNTDGHCSYSPDGKYIITDTYPNRKRIASVYLCTEDDNISRRIVRVFSPFKYDNDCRCDLHPRWNHKGDEICIDSVHDGKRGLYVIDLKDREIKKDDKHKILKVLMVNTVPVIYDGITAVMLNYGTNMNLSDIRLDYLANNDVEKSIRKTIADKGSNLYIIKNRNKKQLTYIIKMAKLIRANKYDIVHIHGNSCTMAIELIAAWLGGTKVRCPHSHNTKCAHNKAHKLLRPVFNLLYTNGFACGADAGKWLFNDREFTILKNGINVDRYKFNSDSRNEYRRKFALENKTAIGHVAHFTYHKNHGFLIDVFNEVLKKSSDYVLVLVGDGKFRNEIEEKVKELGIENNVIFTGTTTDVPAILSAMDIMVLPSLYEGLPNVIIEWQAAGLPVLAADTITDECKLTDLVEFIPLNNEDWVRAIIDKNICCNRNMTSFDACEKIKSVGYDIRMQANELKKMYMNMAKK